ncbi:death-associated protein kinase 1-like [Branchiostoma floridae]|uniref:Death-associated protein kinase 1-like n=1 Tax=Branchiostoma floridae TaxID=7739 RepID=A0A9J7L7G6_BRAFL|nr:death-associated protein kinase 1-like [Branchiostoma floridae]
MDLASFFTAVQEGDVQTVLRGLEAGVDVKVKRDWGWRDQTSLHVASRHGHTKVAELLIQNGADLEVRDREDLTSLHVASKHGQTEVVELLIRHGVDLEAKDYEQSTPLHLAAARGHTGTCELLIRSGAEVMAKHQDQPTTLHRAATGGHAGTCELLIRYGADVNAVGDEVQSTPLHEAAYRGHTGTCELLIRSGADVMARDRRQSTPLHEAAAEGHTGTCELLIRFGADVTARDQDQNTPMHWASHKGDFGTSELLIRSGAEVTARNKGGKTPLDRAYGQETWRFLKNLDKQLKQEKSYHELMQKSGGVKVNRFKVFIGGKEETGKSTLKTSLTKGLLSALIQRLSRRSVEEPHNPTPGVEIGTFHIPGVGEVSVWDFAGQSEYAVTHSMFMDAENTVFIVLYNIMDDSETQERQVHWWLCFIKSCNPNRKPDVILVASHADQVELTTGQRRAGRVVQAMKEDFRDHLRIADEVILMDCRQTRTPEMDKLKSLLVRMRESLLQNQRDMPQLCAKIMECLPQWCKSKISPRCPVMMWPDYVSEVKAIDRHLSEEFLDKSTRFLHHLGEVLFITPATSDPILVLKPNWLGTDVFGPIMAPDNFPIPHRLRTSRDYVTREEIQRVFQDVADVDLVIDLLQEFQLCHSNNGREFIFPGLLTQAMPSDKWQLTQEPKVVYFGKQVQCADSTDMFSSGFFPRVQTRLMRELENPPLLWRDGVKCADRDVEGLIKLSPDGRAVNICVRSAQGDKVQCGKMLQQLENIIADVLFECSPGTGTVENVLSARALKEHREEFYSYSKAEISKATTESSTVHHPILGFTEQVSDLLCREEEDPLTRYRSELVQALRHVEPILDHLLARDILTIEECDVIRANNTPQDRARALLDTVGTKGEDTLEVFQSVLREVEPRAADLLMSSMMSTQRTDEPQDREDQLTRHRPELVRALSHVEPLLDHLQARDVISTEESDIIRTKSTSQERARALLDTVGTKGGDARDVFSAVLEEVNPEAAEIMLPT